MWLGALAQAGGGGGSDVVLYGIPISALIAVAGAVFREMWKDNREQKAEIARLNAQAIERTEKLAVLAAEMTKLVPTMLDRTPTPAQIDQFVEAVADMRRQQARPVASARKR